MSDSTTPRLQVVPTTLTKFCLVDVLDTVRPLVAIERAANEASSRESTNDSSPPMEHSSDWWRDLARNAAHARDYLDNKRPGCGDDTVDRVMDLVIATLRSVSALAVLMNDASDPFSTGLLPSERELQETIHYQLTAAWRLLAEQDLDEWDDLLRGE